jgi:8-oxo-dGTP diphosphatase
MLIILNEGEIILQHRDDKPDISAPNMITLFGGGVDEGESFEDCVLRELKEELSLTVNKEDISLFKVLDFPSIEKVRKFYVVKNVNKKDLILNEGQNIIYLKIEENILNKIKEIKNIHEWAATSILEYFTIIDRLSD